MPRFYFHVYDDIEALDEEGVELPRVEEAISSAVRAARELAADEVRGGKLNLNHRVEVADESGATVATVSFRDSVEIQG